MQQSIDGSLKPERYYTSSTLQYAIGGLAYEYLRIMPMAAAAAANIVNSITTTKL